MKNPESWCPTFGVQFITGLYFFEYACALSPPKDLWYYSAGKVSRIALIIGPGSERSTLTAPWNVPMIARGVSR